MTKTSVTQVGIICLLLIGAELYVSRPICSPISHIQSPQTRAFSNIPSKQSPSLTRYTYIFDGVASDNVSTLYPGAKISIHISSPLGTQVKNTTADDEGHYYLEFNIEAARHSPVDWSVETDSANGQHVELAGRRIVMANDEMIVVRDGRESSAVAARPPSIHYIPQNSYEIESLS